MRIVLSLVFLLLFCCPLRGQGYYFNHLGVDEGLSNTAVLCSAQDKNGFLWFGTKDGLNRFDGYNFKQFYSDADSNNGLGSNFIHSLMVDRNNNIWVGTDQGIYIYNPYLDLFSTFKRETKGEILQIEEDHQGNVWFISNNQLFCFYPVTGQLVQHTRVEQQVVSAFAFDAGGDVWIGSSQHIKNLRTNISYVLPTKHNAPQWIEKIYLDDQQHFWIGSSKHGVYELDLMSGKIVHRIASMAGHSLFVRDIQQADAAHFWIGTESGLIVYNRKTGRHDDLQHEVDHPWSLSDNAVYSICKDQQGGLWIGTFFGGLNYYHKQHNSFEKIFPRFSASSIQGHAVREITQDKQARIWIGTEDNGLYVWDKQSDRFSAFNLQTGLAHTNIHGLALSGDSLLVGTFDRGLDIIDTRSNRLLKHFDTHNTHGQLSNDFIYHIYKTKKGRILLATARGLCEFFPGKDTFRVIPEVPAYIFYTSIFEDAEENLWLATWRDGLYHINHKTGHTKVFLHDKNDTSSLNSNRVNRIFQDSFGHVWIATESGLAAWTQDGKPIRRLTKKDGLPSNLILAMQEDDRQNLWISTTRGLVRMHLPDYRMHIYDKESGLLDLQFNYNSTFKDQRGKLYFGSSRGLIAFHPDSLLLSKVNEEASQLYITKIQSLQRELKVDSTRPSIDTAVTYLQAINLAHDESTISIDFAALNYVAAQSTAYMYMLEGFDKDWTLLRNTHRAHFTKIPPGSYVFRVRAVDADGQSISEEKTLKIRVNPPIWASVPAFLLYILLSGIAIYLTIRSYDQKIKEKNRSRLEAIKAHRERELFKTRMDFFARVAHDIKTPLTLIKAPMERLVEHIPASAKTDRLLSTMQHNTQKLVQLTDQLLDFRKIESSEYSLRFVKHSINQLVTDKLQEFQSVFSQRQLTFTYHCRQVVEAAIDIEVLSKIIDNLLTNAVKYADSQVSVMLEKDAAEQWFYFTVKNDGVLLTHAEVQVIFKPFHRASEHRQIAGTGLGLALSHSFAELHQGTLFFLENSENLNIFVLKIPIKQTYG
ncbi:two-component regulator propeller domain-containing protein [Sphingobacterium oryzagri]|uniref:histidine kinase n=1 Tax=Sphingobacterium oryzagri TaxID=3025669 RepID=A0ABY7WFB9_9SPHI|nr:two-component regulator propeller domain-containing protein [Sphingobacterium sp. KACC 22765]WDF68316.1 two-component regulator propeller domain-containing protein [Sphingobacterium sp. KACC 22765]